jgi:hypothetical protein
MRAVAAILVLLLASAALFAEEKPSRRTAFDDRIDRALTFLQRTQETDGSWRAGGHGKSAAVTGLAVMAFLSAGHVPGEGRFGDTVEKGIQAVLQMQQENGLIATHAGHVMYHHGICTLMLAEVAGMTEGDLAKDVKSGLEKAITVILKAQRVNRPHRGGWRYSTDPGSDSDISVTGWQVMALRAAKNVGCDVPPESIDRAVEYIKSCFSPIAGGFSYMSRGGHATAACTGTSILGLEICGKAQHHAVESLKGGSYLLKHPPRWGEAHFYYSVYYGSQAMFQLGGNYWSAYRDKLHSGLLDNQRDNGCWQGGDATDGGFGANYGTSMAVLALTVEYRYLPIYQRAEEPATK